MEEKKMIYQVIINEIDPATNETKEIHNNKYTGLTMVGTLAEDENRMGCAMLHESVITLAEKLASNKDTAEACRLACAMMDAKDARNGGIEKKLMDAIFGSIGSEG